MSDSILIEYGPTNDNRFLIKVGGKLDPTEYSKAGACLAAAEKLAKDLRAEDPTVEVKVSRRYFTSSVPRQVTEAKAKAAALAVEHADTIAELLTLTIDQLEDALADGSHDEYLDGIEVAEKARTDMTPRKGAVYRIEDRRLDMKDEDEQDALDAEAAREAEADIAAYQEKWATELAILDRHPRTLIPEITNGTHDPLLDSLTQLEAEHVSPRQEVLDALSDRSVAKAQAEAYQDRWATELTILDSQALIADIADGAHDSNLDTLIGVEAEKHEPSATILGALTDRNEAVAEAAAKNAAAKAAYDADTKKAEADAAAAEEAKKTAAAAAGSDSTTAETKPATDAKPDGK